MSQTPNLIIDASNILYRTFFANQAEPEDIAIDMAHLTAMKTMRYFYNKYKPKNIVMAFDHYSWRKAYTKDLSTCATNKKYKGNRRKKLTESQKKRFEKLDQHVGEFFDILDGHTNVVTIKKRFLEADDIIAGFVQMFPEEDHIILSADKDFIQLLENPNVTLIDPQSDKARTLEEWDGDAGLFMFEKCFRGDSSDNVQSSYPRLRKTKIVEAYSDEYKKVTLMENKFNVIEMDNNDNPVEIEYSTNELFEENQLLMCLSSQPEPIRKMINKSIKKALKDTKKFNYVKFIRYCGKTGQQKIVKEIDSFVPMLSNKVKS